MASQNNSLKKKSIIAKGLSKQYIIGGKEQYYESFREYLISLLKSPFRKYKTLKGDVSENLFWALQDVSFDINEGEIVGVIGHNGAGKSTLLKILSRITMPTAGEVQINGRVASLLEVGTGFHPELTGRENIYLNGSILGMTRSQIDKNFDEIVAFAEIEKFLDTPVKRYSSGMYVRLAFAVAAHLDSDVLLVDEVLAVGDQKFQKRCFGKLDEVSRAGRTVLFVSHNLSAVSRLCSKVMVLDKGRVKFYGDIAEGITFYNKQLSETDLLSNDDFSGRGDLYPQVSFTKFEINGVSMQEGIEVDPTQELCFTIYGQCEKTTDYRGWLSIKKDEQLIFSIFDNDSLSSLKKGKFSSEFKVPAYILPPGEYVFSLGGGTDQKWMFTRGYRFVVKQHWEACYDSTAAEMGVINLPIFGHRKAIN